ncbi:uncharacterized protein MYCFIDRAFT_172201 [Pseudocercospora fijiensis CIRAD86]|uniref:Uncharacterized protein n=1 Tax=Pseudocercospora fijiensis (strain CIRAD86) TaxID=383855 RepID=M3APB4_PSEFD|nr:uncharacterized protein MYCFIDRAFT_172201 [Pseudocercospora fijiensis CIRAD86]EME86451.1 hypothetical protein MYCFIDRAFT_172201 [Pseudocercospora fijiensis CIRAD86]
MSGQGDLSDDYVASVMQHDAEKKGQNRYLSTGLGSLLGGRSRPRSDAPKPNTRFLKHLVKEADSHNAALKAKEEKESRRRWKDMRRIRDRDDSRGRRQADQLLSHLGRSSKSIREERRLDDRSHKEKRSRRRSRSPSRTRSPHRKSKRRWTSSASHYDSPVGKPQARVDEFEKYDEALRPRSSSDSNPLETVIGPQPAPKIKARGRGAQSNSTMDARFDPEYDPNTDVGRDLDEEGDDWDMALAALKDRAKWKKTGAERLRAAGFTEEEVSRWEGSGASRVKLDPSEKDISDVRWSKKGEGREWDRRVGTAERYMINQCKFWIQALRKRREGPSHPPNAFFWYLLQPAIMVETRGSTAPKNFGTEVDKRNTTEMAQGNGQAPKSQAPKKSGEEEVPRDRGKSTTPGAAYTSVQARTTSCLLKLAPELRNRIYEHALIADSEVVKMRSHTKPPGLLATCRQIRSEAQAMYYNQNHFRFKVFDCDQTLEIRWPFFFMRYAKPTPFNRQLGPLLRGNIIRSNPVCELVQSRGWNADNVQLPADAPDSWKIAAAAWAITNTAMRRKLDWEDVEYRLEALHLFAMALIPSWK